MIPVTGGVALAGPASALGSDNNQCIVLESVYGTSATDRAKTTTPGVRYCGNARVRASYAAYSSGPIYWTSWVSSSTTAIANPTQSVRNAEHDDVDPAPFFAGLFPFRT